MSQRFVPLTAVLPHPIICIASKCSNQATWFDVQQELFWCDFHAIGEIITPRMEACERCGLGYSPALLLDGVCAYCRREVPQSVNRELK